MVWFVRVGNPDPLYCSLFVRVENPDPLSYTKKRIISWAAMTRMNMVRG